jgi:hypothetical protein
MNRSLSLVFVAFAVAFCVLTANAQAQATRTWVSGVGDDANPCSRTAPCKTWAGAISKTSAGGEIDALDPGGFGALTISGAITIDGGGGGVESTLVSGTPGFTISAGANDVVVLRNLAVNGIVQTGSGGTTGIVFNSGAQLNIEHCVIQNFSGAGIAFSPTGKSFLNVSDTTVESNQGGGIIITAAGSSGPRVTITNSRIFNNYNTTAGTGNGVVGNANTRTAIYNSTISNNQDGVYANGSAAFITIFQSTLNNNEGNGAHASNSGDIAVASSAVSLNKLLGVLADTSGIVSSFGNNYITMNGSGSGTFSPPTITPMFSRLREP